MKRIFSALMLIIILSLFLIQSVNADILSPGDKAVNYCVEISNSEQYNDYMFIVISELRGSYNFINKETCFIRGGNLNTIYALKKTDFNENNIERRPDDFKLKKGYTLNFIRSEINVRPIGIVKSNNPLQKITDVFEIVNLNENNFELKKSKVIYLYTDGTFEEKLYVSQNIRPEPSKKAILPWWFAEFWFIILPFLALIIIIGITIYKRKR